MARLPSRRRALINFHMRRAALKQSKAVWLADVISGLLMKAL
jgi:hypothetical protein